MGRAQRKDERVRTARTGRRLPRLPCSTQHRTQESGFRVQRALVAVQETTGIDRLGGGRERRRSGGDPESGDIRIRIGRRFQDLVAGRGGGLGLMSTTRNHRKGERDLSGVEHPMECPRTSCAVVRVERIAEHDARWEVDEDERVRSEVGEDARAHLFLQQGLDIHVTNPCRKATLESDAAAGPPDADAVVGADTVATRDFAPPGRSDNQLAEGLEPLDNPRVVARECHGSDRWRPEERSAEVNDPRQPLGDQAL